MGNEAGRLSQRNFKARDGRKIRIRRGVIRNKKTNNIRRNGGRLWHRLHTQHHLARSHTVFKCMIPALIGLLQVEYQSKRLSPFETHPVNMWVFLAASCSFGLGLSVEKQFQNEFIDGVVHSSGVLSSVSLASVFLPRLLGWFCLGLWILLPIAFARLFIKQIYNWLKHEIKDKSLLACDKFKIFWGYLTVKNQHLPR